MGRGFDGSGWGSLSTPHLAMSLSAGTAVLVSKGGQGGGDPPGRGAAGLPLGAHVNHRALREGPTVGSGGHHCLNSPFLALQELEGFRGPSPTLASFLLFCPSPSRVELPRHSAPLTPPENADPQRGPSPDGGQMQPWLPPLSQCVVRMSFRN